MNGKSVSVSGLNEEAKAVLVVDDSMTARMRLRSVLEAGGYSVIEADGAPTALRILEKTSVDLITLDVEMPLTDGYVTCELYRLYEEEFNWSSENEKTPIIFVTGNDTYEGRAKGFEVGACEFVLKSSVGKGDFLEAVNRYLRPNLEFEGARVLIVDDSRLVRVMIDRVLQSLGIETEHAQSGVEAYEILKQRSNDTDLVISDNNMPGMSGVELCSKIRRELGLKDLPVLFLSGAERADQLEFYRNGASDCLIKPFLREELVARMRLHLTAAKQQKELRTLREILGIHGDIL
jgi:CheY-like chemotaxis protein